MERILYSDWIPPSCPLGGVSGVGPGSKSPLFGHIINTLLTKLVRSRWLDISLILFEFFIDLDFIPEAGGGGGTLGIFGWGCAVGTLAPLAYTRASSAEFLLPYTRLNSLNIPLS